MNTLSTFTILKTPRDLIHVGLLSKKVDPQWTNLTPYRADMRDADDEVMRRSAAVYVDTRAGALSEGGDLVQALASQALAKSKIVAELADLAGGYPVHRTADQITVFKSVGASIEDLAAAELCWKNASR